MKVSSNMAALLFTGLLLATTNGRIQENLSIKTILKINDRQTKD